MPGRSEYFSRSEETNSILPLGVGKPFVSYFLKAGAGGVRHRACRRDAS